MTRQGANVTRVGQASASDAHTKARSSSLNICGVAIEHPRGRKYNGIDRK